MSKYQDLLLTYSLILLFAWSWSFCVEVGTSDLLPFIAYQIHLIVIRFARLFPLVFSQFSVSVSVSLSLSLSSYLSIYQVLIMFWQSIIFQSLFIHTHTHTHTHIYIYIFSFTSFLTVLFLCFCILLFGLSLSIYLSIYLSISVYLSIYLSKI